MNISDALYALATRLASGGDLHTATELRRLATGTRRMERALDEIAEESRQDAIAAEQAANVVWFKRPPPGIAAS